MSTTPRRPEPPFAVAVLQRCAPLLVVFLLWLLAASTTLTWLRLDNTPPAWDQAVHLAHSLYYYAYFAREGLADAWAGLGLTSQYYPPLTHVVGALCYLQFGVVRPTLEGLTPSDVAVLGNLLWMAVLLFSTYSLAARWYGELAGLLAATLVACYPILSGQSRLFLLDYPLTALMALVMALLVASRGLTHRLWVWPLGVAAGAALWCKWSFLFLIAPPLVVAFLDGLRRLRAGEDEDLTTTRFAFNVVVVLVGLLLLAGPWYLSHPAATVQELRTSNQTWLIDDDPAVFSLAGLTYYLRVLPASQIFLPFTLLAAMGGLCAWLRRRDLAGWPMLVAWLLGGWVVLTLVPNKDPRFSMPLLPAVAVLSCAWLAPPPAGRRPPRHWQRRNHLLVAATLLLALAEHEAVAFGVPFLPSRVGLAAAPLWSDHAHLTTRPAWQDWPHRDLVRDLARVTPPGGLIGVLPNTAHLNYLTVRYCLLWQFLPYLLDTDRVPRVKQLQHETPSGSEPATAETLAADGYDTLVTMTGEQGAHTALIDQTARHLREQRGQLLVAYEPVRELRMPGGETLEVWRRRAAPAEAPR